MALTRHVTAEGDEHTGAKAEFFSAKQRGDDDVASIAEAAIGAQADTVAQAILHQHLLSLREPQLPRRPGVLDRRKR